MHKIDPQDYELVAAAVSFLKANYAEDKHHVACALRCGDKTYYALHLDSRGFDVCAEPIAIANALMDNRASFDAIVAVSWDGGGEAEVVPPCGNCRQLISEYCPEIDVIVAQRSKLLKTNIKKLLPYPYK